MTGKQRSIWRESETQALFEALATQGRTLEELAEAVGTRTMEQVYCKLQNTRTRFKNDDPEIRRVLREEFKKYQSSLKQRTEQQSLLNCEDGSCAPKEPHHSRRIWTREEMDVLMAALYRHGTSISAIARELNNTRTNK